MPVYLAHFSTCGKEREISERKIEEHVTVTEPREVVLEFIVIVNTTVSSAIARNTFR